MPRKPPVGWKGISGFVPPPPADRPFEFHGLVRWPWGTTRRRGYLLEQRVKELEDRLAWIERQLVEQRDNARGYG